MQQKQLLQLTVNVSHGIVRVDIKQKVTITKITFFRIYITAGKISRTVQRIDKQ